MLNILLDRTDVLYASAISLLSFSIVDVDEHVRKKSSLITKAEMVVMVGGSLFFLRLLFLLLLLLLCLFSNDGPVDQSSFDELETDSDGSVEELPCRFTSNRSDLRVKRNLCVRLVFR